MVSSYTINQFSICLLHDGLDNKKEILDKLTSKRRNTSRLWYHRSFIVTIDFCSTIIILLCKYCTNKKSISLLNATDYIILDIILMQEITVNAKIARRYQVDF